MDTTLFSGLRLLASGAETHAAQGADHAAGGHAPMSLLGLGFYFVLVLLIIIGLLTYAKSGFTNRIFKNPISWCAEQVYLFIQNLAVGIMGDQGRKYIPLVMTFWMVIFVGNIVALFSSTSITADLSFNFGMAVMAIFYVQYEGVKANGLVGHLKHFAGPKMGGALVIINFMLFFMELISESMRMVSLSLRLYGNIDGGHKAAEALSDLGNLSIGAFHILIPLGSFLVVIKLLTCVVQALIFCLLFCVYLSLATHHDEEGHGAEHHEGPIHKVPGSAEITPMSAAH